MSAGFLGWRRLGRAIVTWGLGSVGGGTPPVVAAHVPACITVAFEQVAIVTMAFEPTAAITITFEGC